MNILVIDDDFKLTEKLKKFLANNGFTVFVSNTPTEALDQCQKVDIDICLLDIQLPEYDGIQLLKKLKNNSPALEVIMMSGYGTMDSVIESMQLGAIDFLKKPFKYGDLELALKRSNRFLDLQSEMEEVKAHQSLITRELETLIERDFIGRSAKIQKVLELALIAAKDNDINVLITGENGTGKEIIARIIHYSSNRKTKTFYPVNSIAIPDTLLESEFFGHVKGAFTDAKEDKRGFFELANGGTLFLDEIADMPFRLQGKLLRAIEEKQIIPVGSDKLIQFDTRIISATNKNIQQMISDHKFRQDFFHRINAFNIHIPPLKDRPEDIKPLIEYYVQFFAHKKNRPVPVVQKSDVKMLEKYPFPGNVRELRNIIERAFLISNGNSLDINASMGFFQESPTQIKSSFNLNENEKNLIEKALIATNFHQIEAARLLCISRDSLVRRMKKYDITITKNIEN